MSDILEIFGTEYSGVTGIKATDDNGNLKTYIRPQGTQNITSNNTYDVTNLAEIVVNVPSYQLIGTAEFTVSTTSTGSSSVGTVSCYPSPWQHKKIVYVRVRDKAGKRAGYFYGSDAFFMCTNEANGSTSAQQNAAKSALRYTTSNTLEINGTGTYGVYALSIDSNGNVNIYKRYSSSNSLTVDGTYKVEVYLLNYPDGVNPFD